MKTTAPLIWILLAVIFILGLTITSNLHRQNAINRSVEQCAKGSGWLSDADCKIQCTGRTK